MLLIFVLTGVPAAQAGSLKRNASSVICTQSQTPQIHNGPLTAKSFVQQHLCFHLFESWKQLDIHILPESSTSWKRMSAFLWERTFRLIQKLTQKIFSNWIFKHQIFKYQNGLQVSPAASVYVHCSSYGKYSRRPNTALILNVTSNLSSSLQGL